MKTLKYYSIILLCFAFSANSIAQKLDAYTLQLPKLILEKGGSIFVAPLTDNTSEEISNSLSTQFQTEMSQGISTDGLAYDHNIKDLNPWFQTNLYKTTETENEAQYTITGAYQFETNHTKSYTEMSGAEVKDSIPFVYYKFSEKSTAKVTGNVVITDKETGSEIANIPYSKERYDEDTKTMKQASVKDPNTFIPLLTDDFTHSFRYYLNAVKVVFEYDFPKIKPENKDLRKEFREYKRNLKDYADESDLQKMYSLYVEIQQKEDSPEVNECIGMCYEILGNYSKAKTYYETAKSQESLNRIEKQINIKNTLTNLGIEIVEPEF